MNELEFTCEYSKVVKGWLTNYISFYLVVLLDGLITFLFTLARESHYRIFLQVKNVHKNYMLWRRDIRDNYGTI